MSDGINLTVETGVAGGLSTFSSFAYGTVVLMSGWAASVVVPSALSSLFLRASVLTNRPDRALLAIQVPGRAGECCGFDEGNSFRDTSERMSGRNIEFRVRSVLGPGSMIKNLVPAIP